MSLSLHTLRGGARRRRRRVGRGNASGRGTYAGRGQKGQRARSGGRKGLQQKALRALFQRLPKSGGFRSLKEKAAVVTLDALRRSFTAGSTVTPKTLAASRLVPRGARRVKILGTGRLDHSIVVVGCEVSASARQHITAVGGTVSE